VISARPTYLLLQVIALRTLSTLYYKSCKLDYIYSRSIQMWVGSKRQTQIWRHCQN